MKSQDRKERPVYTGVLKYFPDADFDLYKTPDIVSMVLVYRKKLEARWGHQVQINLNQEYRGRNSKELRAELIDAIEKTTLSEFTFRDDTGGTRNYYVDVRAATGIEYTGYDERGTTTITLVEP